MNEWIYRRDLKNFNIENFMFDILAIDWNLIVVFDNANLSFNQFHDTAKITDKYMPLQGYACQKYFHTASRW